MFEYTDVEAAYAAVDVAVADVTGDNDEVNEDDIYHDVAQAIMGDCDPRTRYELARTSGVAVPPHLRVIRCPACREGNHYPCVGNCRCPYKEYHS